MRFLYSLILYLLLPFVLLRLFWLGFKTPAYWSRWNERLGLPDWNSHDVPVLWVHAVSVGEVQAATPLVKRILDCHPQYQILVTTVTPTGAQSVRQQFGEAVRHLYLPYDLPIAVTSFIKRIGPHLLLIMETELWPNLYHACADNGIPVVLTNARLSPRSFSGYKRLQRLTRETLANVSLISAQTQEDASRFIAVGADRQKVVVTGNLKFDINLPRSLEEQAQSLRRYFSVNRTVWIAASTHEDEEQFILQAHAGILKKDPQCLLIIAPRHPERFDKVFELGRKHGFETIRKTDNIECHAGIQVFILDSLGELALYYAASDLAFVGGSLVPDGGHNMLEPASIEVPVISGPYTHNFEEVRRLLVDAGAMRIVYDVDQLIETVRKLIGDANMRHEMGKAGEKTVAENRGSVDRVYRILEKYI
jgi:3-deoxy-D-manno-octulosonic-acid transferase